MPDQTVRITRAAFPRHDSGFKMKSNLFSWTSMILAAGLAYALMHSGNKLAESLALAMAGGIMTWQFVNLLRAFIKQTQGVRLSPPERKTYRVLSAVAVLVMTAYAGGAIFAFVYVVLTLVGKAPA